MTGRPADGRVGSRGRGAWAAAFFVRDRAGRAALLAAAGAALLLPRALRAGGEGSAAAGFRAGLEAGAAGGLLSGLWGVLLLAGVLVLWQGIVSSDFVDGGFRTTLARPVWRPGIYLARHAAAIALLAVAASAVGAVLGGAGAGAVPDPAGLAAASLLTGWTAGALVLLLSSLMDRGDALAAVALLLAPAALDGAKAAGGALSAAARLASPVLPPVLPMAEARLELLAGGWPDASALLPAVAYGAAALALAVVRLQVREFRAG